MSRTRSRELESIFDELAATSTTRLPYQDNVLLRSFILRRPAGNVVVYNSPGVSDGAAAIRRMGAPARLLINHAHEAMYGQPALDVPIWSHRDDRAEMKDSVRIHGTFDGSTTIDDDLYVIPTPGHTSGTTSYLWDSGQHRFLFTGDFIWIEDGEWKAVVLDSDLRQDYVDSLTRVRDLEFDVLVPWGVTEGDSPAFVVRDDLEKRERISQIIERVAQGGNR
ncbi:MBL fold metallo-hydrolase [Prauserella cavernicola]|uniref:MBL fold metallo-hydrolase n=1 Tax=Prauserella cavernicola TaxID=2800127 RepID=A0A934QR74_9PSEU|nr:MBL fold metallo-hydrolase [Prauserella cavernicola]MBK1785090.1 MBL fold metallo-hydrolase [Prauserella cavernicola]